MFQSFIVAIFAGLFCLTFAAHAGHFDHSYKVSGTWIGFPEASNNPADNDHSLSINGTAALEWENDEQSQQIIAEVFGLYDPEDTVRSHLDFRELYWIYFADSWEIKAGFSREFWGVTESQNRVNVINQQDVAKGLDSEYRLGQPMINWISDYEEYGLLSVFLLPYFREQTTFDQGRRGFISSEKAEYQSSDKQQHLDFAVRYNNYIDEHEFALSFFSGTHRQPIYIDSNNNGRINPYYRQMQQWGLEYQFSWDGWLGKLELIDRKINNATAFWAATYGVEYTVVGLIGDTDLGWLVEHNYNDLRSNSQELLQNDTFLGARFSLNDIDSSEVIVGVNVDYDYNSQSYVLTGAKRLGDDIKINFSFYAFSLDQQDPFQTILQHADNAVIELTYHF